MEDLRQSYLNSKRILSGKKMTEPVISRPDDVLEVWNYIKKKSVISTGKSNIEYALSYVKSYIRAAERRKR